jgi:hypothetical protein
MTDVAENMSYDVATFQESTAVLPPCSLPPLNQTTEAVLLQYRILEAPVQIPTGDIDFHGLRTSITFLSPYPDIGHDRFIEEFFPPNSLFAWSAIRHNIHLIQPNHI